MPIIDGHIRCSTCHELKPLAAFSPRSAHRKSGECRECNSAAARERRQARSAEWHQNRRAEQRAHYAQNKETYRAYNLARYNITRDEYDHLLASQGGVCACCGAASNPNGKRLFVDHDHETGAIRGIVCINCNRGIAAFGDDIAGVKQALDYLKRAEWVRVHAPRMRVNLLEQRN